MRNAEANTQLFKHTQQGRHEKKKPHTQRNLPRLEKRAKRQMEMHCNPLENSLTTEV